MRIKEFKKLLIGDEDNELVFVIDRNDGAGIKGLFINVVELRNDDNSLGIVFHQEKEKS